MSPGMQLLNPDEGGELMKQRNWILLLICFSLAAFLSACELTPQQSAGESNASLTLVEPEDGSQVQVGDIVRVRALVSAPKGGESFDLLVNGIVYRSDRLSQALRNGTMLQPWLPKDPGVFTLQVQMTDSTSSGLTSQVVIVNVAGESPEEVQLDPTTAVPPPVDTITPTPTPTVTFTITPTNSQTPTLTLGPPMVTANQYANCRYGPGEVYDVISYLQQNQSSLIVGRNEAYSWWVIQRVDGISGNCWIWDGIVTLSGDTSNVPVIESPPTPTPTATLTPSPMPLASPEPIAPSGSYSCRSTIFLEWNSVYSANGIAYYEWIVEGPSAVESGTTADVQVEFFLPSCASSYRWHVRAVDNLGTIGTYSPWIDFAIE